MDTALPYTVEANGITLACRSCGPQDAPPVLGHLPQDEVARLAELIPDTRMVTVDAGHLVHETRPEEYLAVLEPFLYG
ncbi:alpha/beta fold hydrolase [Streptomyces sp. NPDC002520]